MDGLAECITDFLVVLSSVWLDSTLAVDVLLFTDRSKPAASCSTADAFVVSYIRKYIE